MKKNKRPIFIFAALLLPLFVFLQNKPGPVTGKYIEVRNAKKLIYDKKTGAQRLLGGVNCVHENVVMNCDSAWLYENNTLEAFGNINIRQGDSLFIRGDKLKYDGNTKLATLEGNVSCIEKDMSLSTKSLAYDVNTSTASYFTGGTIQSKNNTLSSRAGSYHSPSKTLSFRYDVKLKNPEYTMACDTLQYNTISRTAYFTGPTTITGDSTIIRTEQGWYSTVQENCRLTKKSEIISGKQILKGDTIIYERRRGYGLAIGNVLLTDTSGESEIQAGKAEYWENAGLSILSGSPLMAQYFEKDTLYLCADTLYSWHEAKSGERILRAYYRCKLFKRDLQGICDSIVYKTEDSLMTLYHSPVLWSSDCQLSSKKIIVKTGKKRILGFELQENAFVTQLADSNSFNQISGRTINGICKNDKITDIFVKGNAQSLYFLKEKQKVIGMNKTECSEMRIKMAGNGIDQITFIKKPVSSILPLTDLTESDKKLKGFVWRTEKKPTSVSDLRN